jgi:hypothetical protein
MRLTALNFCFSPDFGELASPDFSRIQFWDVYPRASRKPAGWPPVQGVTEVAKNWPAPPSGLLWPKSRFWGFWHLGWFVKVTHEKGRLVRETKRPIKARRLEGLEPSFYAALISAILSESVHSARLRVMFWSMPFTGRVVVRRRRPLAERVKPSMPPAITFS